jgi:hypothetical protein
VNFFFPKSRYYSSFEPIPRYFEFSKWKKKKCHKCHKSRESRYYFWYPRHYFWQVRTPATSFELKFLICSLPEAGNADTDPAHLNGWQ